jgi:hypothetical protein
MMGSIRMRRSYKEIFISNQHPMGKISDPRAPASWQRGATAIERSGSGALPGIRAAHQPEGPPMKKLATFASLSAAALMLSACGSSDSAKEEAQAGNVELPAEEAVGDIEAAATPVSDAAASATAAPSDAAAAASGEAAPAEAAQQ